MERYAGEIGIVIKLDVIPNSFQLVKLCHGPKRFGHVNKARRKELIYITCDDCPLDEQIDSMKVQKRMGQDSTGPSQMRQRRGGKPAEAAGSEKQVATDSWKRG